MVGEALSMNLNRSKSLSLAITLLILILTGCKQSAQDKMQKERDQFLLIAALANTVGGCNGSDLAITSNVSIGIYRARIPADRSYRVCGTEFSSLYLGSASQAILTLPTSGEYRVRLEGAYNQERCGNSTITSAVGVSVGKASGGFVSYNFQMQQPPYARLLPTSPTSIVGDYTFVGTAGDQIIVQGSSGSGGFFCLGGQSSSGRSIWQAHITPPGAP